MKVERSLMPHRSLMLQPQDPLAFPAMSALSAFPGEVNS
jgi:hypothetical protein